MAKKPTAANVAPAAGLNLGLLSVIVAATKSETGFVQQLPADVAAFLQHSPPLVEQAGVPDAEGKLATRATQAGMTMIDGATPAPSVAASTTASKYHSPVVVVQLGKKERKPREGVPGASKYDFEQLPAPTAEQATNGQWPSFFVPNDGDKDMTKTLASTVNNARKRLFGKVVGQETVERAKRGPGRGAKAVIGPDGKKVMETVTVDKYEYSGKFEIFPVSDGAPWGAEYAGKAGVAICRTE
jgi:hypothetical protein